MRRTDDLIDPPDPDRERLAVWQELKRLESAVVAAFVREGLEAEPLETIWTFPTAGRQEGVTLYRFDVDRLLSLARLQWKARGKTKGREVLDALAGVARVLFEEGGLWQEFHRGPSWKLAGQLALMCAAAPDPIAIERVLSVGQSRAGKSGGLKSGEVRRQAASDKLEAAVRALLQLRQRNDVKPYTCRDIAEASGLSPDCVRRLKKHVIEAHADEIVRRMRRGARADVHRVSK